MHEATIEKPKKRREEPYFDPYAGLHPVISSFERFLDMTPANWDLRLAYSECLWEIGELILSAGQKWQYDNQKWPELWKKTGLFLWSSGHHSDRKHGDIDYKLASYFLTHPITKEMPSGSHYRREAEVAMAYALGATGVIGKK